MQPINMLGGPSGMQARLQCLPVDLAGSQLALGQPAGAPDVHGRAQALHLRGLQAVPCAADRQRYSKQAVSCMSSPSVLARNMAAGGRPEPQLNCQALHCLGGHYTNGDK